MTAPTTADVLDYLRTIDSQAALDTDTVAGALAVEAANQARVCRVPADPAATWPPDLVGALCRRVGVNLARRPYTLGFVPSLDPAAGASYLSTTDAEVRRLEVPHRRMVIG